MCVSTLEPKILSKYLIHIDTFKVTKVFPPLVLKGGTKFKGNQSKMLGGVVKKLSPCQILSFENEGIRRRIAKYIASLLQMARSLNYSFVNTICFMSPHIHSFTLRGDNWILLAHRPLVYCYLEFKLSYLKNLKFFSIRVKELSEPILL